MTDKKLTDEEIIKALECCLDISPSTCKNCPLFNVTNPTMVCSKIATKSAIDLINRQQEEIERLKECPKCIYEYDGEVTEYCVKGPCPNFKTVEQIKAEVIKEFAEKLKEKSFKAIRNYGLTKDVVEVCDIDNLSKEMVGEEE